MENIKESRIKLFDSVIEKLNIVNVEIDRACKLIEAYNNLSFDDYFKLLSIKSKSITKTKTRKRFGIREMQKYKAFNCIRASLLSTKEVYLLGV